MTDLATEQEQNTKNRLQPSQIENVSTLECKKNNQHTPKPYPFDSSEMKNRGTPLICAIMLTTWMVI
jgi:hypothetical protein